MGFSNPSPTQIPEDLARESAAQQIETVAEAIRGGIHGYPWRDRLFWSAVSGEDLAPTLGGTAIYTSKIDVGSVYQLRAAGDWADWDGPLARVSPHDPTKTTLTCEFAVYFPAGEQWEFIGGLGATNSAAPIGGFYLQCDLNGDLTFSTNDGDNATGPEQTVAAVGLAGDTLHRIRIEAVAGAATTLHVNDAEQAAHGQFPVPDDAFTHARGGFELISAGELNVLSLEWRWDAP